MSTCLHGGSDAGSLCEIRIPSSQIYYVILSHREISMFSPAKSELSNVWVFDVRTFPANISLELMSNSIEEFPSRTRYRTTHGQYVLWYATSVISGLFVNTQLCSSPGGLKAGGCYAQKVKAGLNPQLLMPPTSEYVSNSPMFASPYHT